MRTHNILLKKEQGFAALFISDKPLFFSFTLSVFSFLYLLF